jgi:hypothetical protein
MVSGACYSFKREKEVISVSYMQSHLFPTTIVYRCGTALRIVLKVYAVLENNMKRGDSNAFESEALSPSYPRHTKCNCPQTWPHILLGRLEEFPRGS